MWSDGTPISWEDIASQIHATSGQDKTFAIAGTSGSERVESVTRGVDDRQAVMTFAKPYAEWRGMFAGNGMLLPKSMTATPEAFNKGQLSGPGPSAGPFIVSRWIGLAQRIVLTRNPKWWGARPRLDSITYLVLDDAARIAGAAEQHHRRHRGGQPGPVDHRAAHQGHLDPASPRPELVPLHLQRCDGSILADTALRLAVSKGIDRQSIAKVAQYGLSSNPAALDNHIYVAGQQGYQDNSAVVAYDPEQGQARAGRPGLEAQRPVPRKGRPAARRSAICSTTRRSVGSSLRSRSTASLRSA